MRSGKAISQGLEAISPQGFLLQLGQKRLDPLVEPPAVAVALEADLDEAVNQLRQRQAGEA